MIQFCVVCSTTDIFRIWLRFWSCMSWVSTFWLSATVSKQQFDIPKIKISLGMWDQTECSFICRSLRIPSKNVCSYNEVLFVIKAMNFTVKIHIQPSCSINTNVSDFRWMLNMTLKLHTLHLWLITPTHSSQQTSQILSSWTTSLDYMFKKPVGIRPQMAYRFTGKVSCKVTKSAVKYPS